MKTKIVILSLVGLFSLTALAQQQAAPATTKAKGKNGRISVSFGDELVQGGTQLPDADLIQNRLENRFKRFIKIRKDFIQDVENTKDEFGHR